MVRAILACTCSSVAPTIEQFVRNEAYTSIKKACPTGARNQIVLVCKEWARSAFMNERPLDVFDECGLSHSSPCVNAAGQQIPSVLVSYEDIQPVD